ncbi:hypothetical protein CRENBAI_023892 [Crenichthys baileyi]|uniref:Uncharacterized protein n=1 Tax=Crenichthys baileyi TaxID=28760 RepID=A0AAV9SK23_9TELE
MEKIEGCKLPEGLAGGMGVFYSWDHLTHLTIETEQQRAVVEISPLFHLIPGGPDSVGRPPPLLAPGPIPLPDQPSSLLPTPGPDPFPYPVPEGFEDERPPIVPVLEGFEDELLPVPVLEGFKVELPPVVPVREGSATDLQGSATDLNGLAEGSSGFCIALPSSTAGFLVADLLNGVSEGPPRSMGPLHVWAVILTSLVGVLLVPPSSFWILGLARTSSRLSS